MWDRKAGGFCARAAARSSRACKNVGGDDRPPVEPVAPDHPRRCQTRRADLMTAPDGKA
jgi:hypothetical protein